MWRTWARKSRADLRSRGLQAAVLFLMLAAAAATATLAFTVDRTSTRIVDDVLEDANAAHLWVNSSDPATLARVGRLAGVIEAGQVFPTLLADVFDQGESHPVRAWGVEATPVIGPGLLREGRWPDPARDDEIVVGVGLADAGTIGLGDELLLRAEDGRLGAYAVVGIVTPTVRAPYPAWTPGTVFVSRTALLELAGVNPALPNPLSALDDNVVLIRGLRIAEPEQVFAFGATLPEGAFYNSWVFIRDGMVGETEAPTVLLRVFAIFAVVAAAFLIVAAVTNHTAAQRRDIGLLKAMGLTPRQTSLLLLGQLLAISATAGAVGVGVGVAATPLFLWSVTDTLHASRQIDADPTTLAGVFVAVQALVLLGVFLPAWHAGRAGIVEAIALGPRCAIASSSHLAAAIKRLHFPQVVVCGVKDSFSRPLRSWLTVAAIAVAAATLMMTFTFQGSLNRILDRPALVGSSPLDLRAERLEGLTAVNADATAAASVPVISPEETGRFLDADPVVAAYITDRPLVVQVGEFRLLSHVVSGDIDQVGFVLLSGRLLRGLNEVVLGGGLAIDFGLGPGDEIPVEVLPGRSVTMTVVGTYATEENGGDVLMYGLETARALDPTFDAGGYGIDVADGVGVATAQRQLIEASGGRLAVRDLTLESDNNVEDERRLVTPMTALAVALALLAAANLFSSLVFAVRERTREFGTLKAIGFTPGQVVGTVVAGMAPLALLGTLIGAPVGFFFLDWLIRMEAEDYLPKDLVRIPSPPWLIALVGIAFTVAVVGSIIPARRAGSLRAADALRAE